MTIQVVKISQVSLSASLPARVVTGTRGTGAEQKRLMVKLPTIDFPGGVKGVSSSDISVKARYEAAVAALVERLKQDRMVLAVILCGSLAYDEVWEKSDIDLILVGEEKTPQRGFGLVEDGINIHATMMPRSALKKIVEGSLQSAFFHSLLSKGRILYTADDSLPQLYESLQSSIGARDRASQLLNTGSTVFPALAKAEKWFHVKRDLHYTLLWILFTAEALARIEVIANGQVTGREVLQQALRINPVFFRSIYTDLIDGPKDTAALGAALDAINSYLEERIGLLFQPILDHLSEVGGPRSTTELNEHFKRHHQAIDLVSAYEWLADKGIITKVPLPLRLTEKSRVTVNEAGYYYDGEPTV